MKRLIVGAISVAVLVAIPRITTGQTKTISSEMRVETGVVEAIEASSRKVTLRKPDGTMVTTVAGPEVKRFDEVKIGDKITARYYDNVVLRLKRPGESEEVSAVKGTTGADQPTPGGTKAKQMTLTVTITAIDTTTPSITFTGPEGYKYVQGAGPRGTLQGQGRRQGRHRLDRSAAGVARAR
jgi:hypothetical protein